MRITVKYGLPFREHVGAREEVLEIEKNSPTVAEALQMIVRRHSVMKEYVDAKGDEAQRRHLTVAVNRQLARLSDILHDGDSVSLLLPVTGGCAE